KNSGRIVGGRFAIRNVLAEPVGTASLRIDTLTVAGVLLDTLGAEVRLAGRSRAAFTIGARSDNGLSARVVGDAFSTGGPIGARGAMTRIDLDSLGLTIGESRWRLAGTSHATVSASCSIRSCSSTEPADGSPRAAAPRNWPQSRSRSPPIASASPS